MCPKLILNQTASLTYLWLVTCYSKLHDRMSFLTSTSLYYMLEDTASLFFKVPRYSQVDPCCTVQLVWCACYMVPRARCTWCTVWLAWCAWCSMCGEDVARCGVTGAGTAFLDGVPMNIPLMPSSDGWYKCEECGYQTPNREHYKSHVMVHRPPKWKCFYCEQKYPVMWVSLWCPCLCLLLLGPCLCFCKVRVSVCFCEVRVSVWLCEVHVSVWFCELLFLWNEQHCDSQQMRYSGARLWKRFYGGSI